MKLVWVHQCMSHLLVRIGFSNAMPLVGKLASCGTALLHTLMCFMSASPNLSTHAYITSCTIFVLFLNVCLL